MQIKMHRLTAEKIAALTEPGLYADGAGLYFQISTAGARYFCFRYSKGPRGQRKTHSLGLGGLHDAIGNARERNAAIRAQLVDARTRAAAMRATLKACGDPATERAKARATDDAHRRRLTFADAVPLFLAAKTVEFTNPKHAAQWKSTLETYAIPIIGKTPIADVTRADVLRVLTQVDKKGAEFWSSKTETAGRVRGRMEKVFGWAKAAGQRGEGDNPAAWKNGLDALLARPGKIQKIEHHAAMHYRELPAFKKALSNEQGLTAMALQLLILTACRSNETRGATWSEIDEEAATWTIPAERMKAKKAHVVPLCKEALRLLRSVPRIVGQDLIFSYKGKPLSENAFRALLVRMGEQATAHGFRSSFKDWSRAEQGTAFADEVSELCLAHVSSDATRAAYARDGLLSQRRELLERWADYLQSSVAATVVALAAGG